MKIIKHSIDILNNQKLQWSQAGSCINIVMGFVSSQDINDLFSDDDIINVIPKNISLPIILKLCGWFKSTNEASKNGWKNIEIKPGWNEFVVRKEKFKLFILYESPEIECSEQI